MQRPISQNRKHTLIVIALGLPGALCLSFFGLMVAAFAGDAYVTPLTLRCWLFWGAVGGGCIGALPGIIAGLYFNIRWVIPLLGGAVGAIPGLIESFGIHLTANFVDPTGETVMGRQAHLGGYTGATSIMLGLLVGFCVWRADVKRQRTAADQKAALRK